jgi:YegS/Rv2252/BmrU family lipid kinase
MPGIPLIHNPAARSEKSARLARIFEHLEPRPRVLATDGPGNARRLAAECARRGDPVIVAGGGDGTVNEVVAGLHDAQADGHTDTALALMPLGTMNVFALEMGLPVRNIRQCWKIAVEGKTRPVDLWLANGQAFIQLGGVGVDATVIAETPWEMKRRIGPLSYLVQAARVLTRPAPKLVAEIDGEEVHGVLVLFGNGQHYGGPIKAFPDARTDDGLIDVLILREQTTATVIGFLGALATGNIENFSGVWQGRGKVVKITSQRAVPCELDGEAMGETPVEICLATAPIQVCVPA